nr:cathelicidin-B1-like [Anas platyrhynchos]|eukprot:XP_027305985.1 cathelicidin-B1-like [Anas platyrhynchos]
MRPCCLLLLLLLAPAAAVSPQPDTSPVPGLEGTPTAEIPGSVPIGSEGSVAPGQDGSRPPSQPWRWPSGSLQAVLEALRLLHRGSKAPCALRLRVTGPERGWPQRELTFLVQDAWCQPAGTPPAACPSCHTRFGRNWGAWIRERWASFRQRLRDRGRHWTWVRRSHNDPRGS